MKISIIIPTARPGKLIDFQLPSFAKQTFPKEEFEIVIIDDCIKSRKDQVEEFRKANGMNIKWMRSKKPYYRSNANIGCARNTGLIYALGELIVFIDDFSYVMPNYLDKVWKIYKSKPKISHIGPVVHMEHREPPYVGSVDSFTKRKDSRHNSCPCRYDWFFTSNASAPLNDIIKVNGFWEMADLTREEDVLMGYALDRVGRKFCYIDEPELSVYHMSHGVCTVPRRFKEISFSDLGWDTIKIKNVTVMGLGGKGRCGLNTGPDEIQRVTRDIFNTRNPGSWALIEYFGKNRSLKFNQEIGFNLAEERRKIGL